MSSSKLARLPVLLAVLLLLVAAPAAEARWFAAEPIDTGERPVVDLGIEEGGGLVYLKGGTAWLSQLGTSGWSAPAAISGANTTEAVVAAGADGRLAAAWIQDGNVVGALVGAPAAPLSSGGGASGLAIEIGVNGVAYAVWTQNGDVRAARLHQSSWEAVPAPLDIDPARTARRSRRWRWRPTAARSWSGASSCPTAEPRVRPPHLRDDAVRSPAGRRRRPATTPRGRHRVRPLVRVGRLPRRAPTAIARRLRASTLRAARTRSTAGSTAPARTSR